MDNKYVKLDKKGIRIIINLEQGRVDKIQFKINDEYRDMLSSESEFTNSYASCGGEVDLTNLENNQINIKTKNDIFDAKSEIFMDNDGFHRTQTYSFKKDFNGYISTSFECEDKKAKYTYTQRVYDELITNVEDLRNDYLWALPLPAHLWHGDDYCATYCLDKEKGVGTCDFKNTNGSIKMGTYYPDTAEQKTVIMPFSETNTPNTCDFKMGQSIKICEYISFSRLEKDENYIIQSLTLASDYLLKEKQRDNYDNKKLEDVADGIANYYINNDLWNDNALGTGKGWYRNMWKHTDGGVPNKDFYYDFGWGEGYGVLTLSALVRYAKRTGKNIFDHQIEQITNNMSMFLRNENKPGCFYDRFIPTGKPSLLGKFHDYNKCDFLGIERIWIHSLAMVGYQLMSLCEDVDYHNVEFKNKWFNTAKDIALFLMSKQKANGDINDGFDEEDGECNKKRHRIPARVIACGLLTKMYIHTKEKSYLDSAIALGRAVAPEIEKYQFFNQMLDAHVDVINGEIVVSGSDDSSEVWDSENACYAFLGLVDLYETTKDKQFYQLCEKCAAYFISWMYFYDVKTGVNGRSCGATTCRMPDFPLIYLGAGNFAYPALVKFGKLTNNKLYSTIAIQMLNCSADYQLSAPGKAWDKGIVHAVYQVTGKHWGENIEGQMDTGMTSGSTLINIEKYLMGI